MAKDAELEERAKAILNETLAEEYERIRECDDFEESIIQELEHLSIFVLDADTRTLCILTTSYLEDTLRQNFVRVWGIEGKTAQERYFGSNGPLSTFSQRALVASGLGWLSPAGLKDASTLRKIRNEFAHNHRVHSFADERVRDLVTNLQPREQKLLPIGPYKEGYGAANDETRMRVRFFSSASLLTAQMLSRSKSILHGLGMFRPSTGYQNASAVEQRTIDLTIRHSFAALGLHWDEIRHLEG